MFIVPAAMIAIPFTRVMVLSPIRRITVMLAAMMAVIIGSLLIGQMDAARRADIDPHIAVIASRDRACGSE